MDYIWLLNPSEPRRPVIDWTDMVFSEIAQELMQRGFAGPQQAWELFSGLTGMRSSVDVVGFKTALRELGFGSGARLATLTTAEIALLVSSCDVDGDGFIDSNEWCDRFSRALDRLQGDDVLCDAPTEASDLQVVESRLTPECLEAGRWPAANEWSLSDHGVLTSSFRLREARREGAWRDEEGAPERRDASEPDNPPR